MIFFVQATADIESRGLLALIVISLQLALESPCCANGRSHFITKCIFYVVTRFHMVLHMTIADSRRYPVLWMSLDRLVGGSATAICIVLISLLFASVSYALLRFDQMHRATLELSLASEAICSQAPHQTQIWQTCEIDGNRGYRKTMENHPEIGCFRLPIARLPEGTAVHRTNFSSNA